MKRRTMKRLSCLLCAILLILTGLETTAFAADVSAQADGQATVWVVGDSTVCSFSDSYYYPRYGWGTQLFNYFDDTLTVQNLALSGRSTGSFTSDANYTKLLNGMKSGDYLLIGFGHNDEKPEEGRYTNPNGDYKTEGSFAYSLYENYIKPAQAAGVTVVVCTPIVRRTASGEWSNSNLHITSDSGSYQGGDYPQAIRKLGEDTGVAVVDMTTLTKNLYDSLGAAETAYLHAWTSSKADSVDNTHTNIWGAKYNAYMLTQEIKRLNVAGIADHILSAEAPTKADTLVVNPNYKEVAYTPVTGESKIWEKAGVFSGTVFGDGVGTPSKTNQTLEMDADGNIHIAAKNNKGKIGSTTDGILMYYYKVPASSDFTLTANATINSYDVNGQVSFGLMARDDMYLDTNISGTTLGDYVAAGPLKLDKAGSVWNCFARKSGKLTQGGTCKNEVVAGSTVALKIQSNSDGYACTFGEEETITGGFDFKLTTIDSSYVYVGMFAARNADITFSDVALVVDGEVIYGNPVIEEVDFTKLDAAIAEAEKLTDSDYKDFTAVETALAAAKEVNRETATQTQVNTLTKNINDAMAALEKVKPVEKKNGFVTEDGKKYWYEDDVKQGTEGRGKEIYDPETDAWYWLDAVQGGAVATGKDVYQESNGGKWVRYDENGLMIKGWQTTEAGTYYFDLVTGAMIKSEVTVDNTTYRFDEITGTLLNQKFYTDANGNRFWYENGIRQGTEGRGKEIYDPETDAWYWLDAVDNGKVATSKDVYQESWAGQFADREDGTGKWVRYDENGHMIKGWSQQNGHTYYFDMVTGAMAKGNAEIDGVQYTFDLYTGVLQ